MNVRIFLEVGVSNSGLSKYRSDFAVTYSAKTERPRPRIGELRGNPIFPNSILIYRTDIMFKIGISHYAEASTFNLLKAPRSTFLFVTFMQYYHFAF